MSRENLSPPASAALVAAPASFLVLAVGSDFLAAPFSTSLAFLRAFFDRPGRGMASGSSPGS
jgi:hypothetical protein